MFPLIQQRRRDTSTEVHRVMAEIENKNCEDCDEEDEIDDMVCCDLCKKWRHFHCAGVQSSIKNKEWLCSPCIVKSTTAKNSEVAKLRESVKELAVTVKELKRAIVEPKTAPASIPALPEGCASQGNDVTVPKKEIEEKITGAVPKSIPQGTKSFVHILSKLLPCKSLDELDSFLLKVIESEAFFVGLVAYIRTVFGKDVRKSIKSALDLLIDKNVQKLLSWSGLRTKKPSFEKEYKPIVNAIDQALNEKFSDYDYSVLSDKIQALLQTP